MKQPGESDLTRNPPMFSARWFAKGISQILGICVFAGIFWGVGNYLEIREKARKFDQHTAEAARSKKETEMKEAIAEMSTVEKLQQMLWLRQNSFGEPLTETERLLIEAKLESFTIKKPSEANQRR